MKIENQTFLIQFTPEQSCDFLDTFRDCKLLITEHKEALLNVDGTPEILDVHDVAELLKITSATVHDWKRKGMLPYRKKGDRTYFLKSEIIASLQKPEIKRTIRRKKTTNQ